MAETHWAHNHHHGHSRDNHHHDHAHGHHHAEHKHHDHSHITITLMTITTMMNMAKTVVATTRHHLMSFKTRVGKNSLGLFFSVGLRPCSGALVVLAFALSQDLLFAGIVATFLMGLGTAIAVSILAAIAVYFKAFAQKQATAGSSFWGQSIAIAELVGAFVVFGFGALLLWAAL